MEQHTNLMAVWNIVRLKSQEWTMSFSLTSSGVLLSREPTFRAPFIETKQDRHLRLANGGSVGH